LSYTRDAQQVTSRRKKRKPAEARKSLFQSIQKNG